MTSGSSQICIVCEKSIDQSEVAPGIRLGDLVICKGCDEITPNRWQAGEHWRNRYLQWARQLRIEEAAKLAYTHLNRLDQCGALTREDDPILEALKKALEP